MRIPTQSITCIAFILAFAVTGIAHAFQLESYKDRLFAYPHILGTTLKERFISVGYDKQRDIIERDEIPLRRVKREYVNENVRWSRRVRSYKAPGGTFKYFAVGKYKGGAKLAVIFIHGKNGNRFLGVNDWTFGGNFNRLQNLMVRNNGLLLTPEFTNFKQAGANDIAILMREYRKKSSATRMIVACGSMGAGVCWHLANNRETVGLMDGMFILGGHWNDDFLKTTVVRNSSENLPIFFAHGGNDTVFSAKSQKNFFKSLLKAAPAYPTRFVMFETGVHGTPIRMVDWRQELNWMLTTFR